MRIAALYDIHGNLPALEAVLEEVIQEGVDQLVVGGDVVAGPMPRETLQRLIAMPVPVQFIQGNADTEIAAQMLGRALGAVPDSVLDVVRWTAQELAPETAHELEAWPLTLTIAVEGLGRVLFCHATPRSNTQVFTKLTPESQIQPAFGGVNADLVICGHTHMPFDRQIGNCRVVNAGSVGMPYGQTGAHWLLLDHDVKFRRTLYDLATAAERIQATTYPHAAQFAVNNILQVPTEEEALTVFSKIETGQQGR